MRREIQNRELFPTQVRFSSEQSTLVITSLPCCPVFVPHSTGGLLPVGPVMVKLSVQTPDMATSVMSKNVKSNL
jgi:hypothetical protein